MNTISVPTKEEVNPESQAIFDQLQKALGKVPNLYATIGYSSHALKAWVRQRRRYGVGRSCHLTVFHKLRLCTNTDSYRFPFGS